MYSRETLKRIESLDEEFQNFLGTLASQEGLLLFVHLWNDDNLDELQISKREIGEILSSLLSRTGTGSSYNTLNCNLNLLYGLEQINQDTKALLNSITTKIIAEVHEPQEKRDTLPNDYPHYEQQKGAEVLLLLATRAPIVGYISPYGSEDY